MRFDDRFIHTGLKTMRVVDTAIVASILTLVISAGCSHTPHTTLSASGEGVEVGYSSIKPLASTIETLSDNQQEEKPSRSIITDPLVLRNDPDLYLDTSKMDREESFFDLAEGPFNADIDFAGEQWVGDNEKDIDLHYYDLYSSLPRYSYYTYYGYMPEPYDPYFWYPWPSYHPWYTYGSVTVIRDHSNGVVTTVGVWPPQPTFVSPLSDFNPFWGYPWGSAWYRYHYGPYYSFDYPWGWPWYYPYYGWAYYPPHTRKIKPEPRESKPMISERNPEPRISLPTTAYPNNTIIRTPLRTTALGVPLGVPIEENISFSNTFLTEPARTPTVMNRKNERKPETAEWDDPRSNSADTPQPDIYYDRLSLPYLKNLTTEDMRIFSTSKGSARSRWFTQLDKPRVNDPSNLLPEKNDFEIGGSVTAGASSRSFQGYSPMPTASNPSTFYRNDSFNTNRYSFPPERNLTSKDNYVPSYSSPRQPASFNHETERSINSPSKNSISNYSSSESRTSASPAQKPSPDTNSTTDK